MKNKKFLIAMLSVCFLASCAFGIACKGGDDAESATTSSETVSTVKVTLDERDLSLEVYDKATLTATVKGSEEAVVWSSSAPNVATVDSEGNIVAVAAGETVITATVEGGSASCIVSVAEATTAPVIRLSSQDVRLNIGGSFASEMKTYWKGEEIEEAVTYTCSLIDGQAADVATATVVEDMITFNGLKAGSTAFRVTVTARGISVSTDVNVTVYENDLSIVSASEVFVPASGYYTLDLATATIDDYRSSEALSFVVYENGVEVKDAQIEWTVENDSVIKLEEGNVLSTGVGETRLLGTCTVNDVTTNITITVNVIKPIIALVEPTVSVLEVENLSTLTIETELIGTIQSVQSNGKEVLKSVSGQTITFNKENMPKLAENLGEQTLYVATETVIYKLPVTLYTMIINDKAEMDAFVKIAKANAPTEIGIWDGYFLLGNDIDYNGEFVPMTSHNHLYALGEPARSARYNPSMVGFRGVFDGQGYNIDGLSIGVHPQGGTNAESGIFGVINQKGIVRNISFTNAVSRENSGYIAASGGGLIENISITYKQIGMGVEVALFGNNDQPRIMSSFYSTKQGITETAAVRNCFIDASNATIPYWNEKAEKRYMWSSIQLAGKESVMDNVIVILPNATLADVCGSPQTFASYEDFKNDDYAQAQYKAWDANYWTNINGIPFTVNMANKVDREAEISFQTPDAVFVGRQTKIDTIGAYTKVALAEEYAGVTYKNGFLTATEEAVGTTVTLVLTSYINNQIVEKDIAIKMLKDVELEQTQSVFLQSSDTELDLAVASQYIGGNATAYIGTTVVGNGTVANGKLAIDMSNVPSMEYGETTMQIVSEKDDVYYAYDLKIFYVTKVIKTVDEMKAVVVTEGLATPITGYYILGNDIDFQGAKTSAGKASIWNSVDLGFRGTFDGNGKTISNMAVASNGLFGQIGKGAVIKDVNFDKVVFSQGKWQKMALLANVIQQATIQNINVKITEYHISTDDKNVTFVEQGLLASRYLLGNTIENVTIHAEGIELYRLMGRVSGGNKISNMTIYAKSYQTIGDSDDNWTAITDLPMGITFIADGTESN